MKKQHVLALLSIILLIAVAVNFSVAGATDSMTVSSQDTGVVDKNPGDAFTVTIQFQNTGTSQATWTVNVVFEGQSWTWKGTAKTLTLDANEKKSLVWNGNVPANAAANSVARLVVYYGDSFKVLNWWIEVTPNAVLSIQSSNVQ